MEKIAFIYCYRDKELIRIRQSLDSLALQTEKSFKVYFVDFGSEENHALEVERMVSEYPFVTYIYNDTRGMMWNRSHALNTAIRITDTEYVFTSDIDMIYEPGFVKYLNEIADPWKAFFFSAILLPENVLPGNKLKERSYPRTTDNALGWGLIPVARLNEIGSYDEVYCIWGKEDNDIGHRLRVSGIKVSYIKDIWMYHYYHQPVPLQREVLPDDWFAFLKDYFESMASDISRNVDQNWGKLYPKNSRPAFRSLQDPSTTFRLVDGRSRYFRYVLETAFLSSEAGKELKFLFRDKISENFKSSNLSRYLVFINRIFSWFALPIYLKSVYERNYEDIYDTRNELMFFLISRMNLIDDYAYEIKGHRIKVVFIKG
jgi:glycosyltransferase involved in cell wall biosynthesis